MIILNLIALIVGYIVLGVLTFRTSVYLIVKYCFKDSYARW